MRHEPKAPATPAIRRRDACALGLALAAGFVHARNPGLVQGPKGEWVAPDVARVLHRRELVVAMLGTDSPPFFYLRDGELAGIDVRMGQELAAEFKVKVRFDRRPRTFDQVTELVVRGEADMAISKLSRTLRRHQAVRFSDPYLRLKHALLLNRVELARLGQDRPLAEVMRDFKGTIGVIANSSFETFAADNFPRAKRVSFPTWDGVVTAVKRGKISAAYRDEFEIRRLLAIEPALAVTLRTVAFTDLEDTLGIAVGIRDTALLAVANQYLSQLPEKLTVERVLQELKQEPRA
jgi:polar amino acid transport system substrate-binding protein